MNRMSRLLKPLASLTAAAVLLVLAPQITVSETHRFIDAATGEFVVRTVRWGLLRSEERRPTAMRPNPGHRDLFHSSGETTLIGGGPKGTGIDSDVVQSALDSHQLLDRIKLSAAVRDRLSDAYWSAVDGAAAWSPTELEHAVIDAFETKDEAVLAAALDRLGVP